MRAPLILVLVAQTWAEPAAAEPPGSGPSVSIAVRAADGAEAAAFVRAALIDRLRVEGYCLATEPAELSLEIAIEPEAMQVVVRGGAAMLEYRAAERGMVAVLEAIHRAENMLARLRTPSMVGAACRATPPKLAPVDERSALHAALPARTTPPVALHATAHAGASMRPGGFDAAVLARVGVLVPHGLVVAGEVGVIPARLRADLTAIDVDVTAAFGLRRVLERRWGVDVAVVAGARFHRHRLAGGWRPPGPATWVVGLSGAAWWTLVPGLALELRLTEHVSGNEWLHRVGARDVGRRGRFMTLVLVGVAWSRGAR